MCMNWQIITFVIFILSFWDNRKRSQIILFLSFFFLLFKLITFFGYWGAFFLILPLWRCGKLDDKCFKVDLAKLREEKYGRERNNKGERKARKKNWRKNRRKSAPIQVLGWTFKVHKITKWVHVFWMFEIYHYCKYISWHWLYVKVLFKKFLKKR